MVEALSVLGAIEMLVSLGGAVTSASRLIRKRFSKKDLNKLLRKNFVKLIERRGGDDAALEELKKLIRESDVLLDSLKTVLTEYSLYEDFASDFQDDTIGGRYLMALEAQRTLATDHFQALLASLGPDLEKGVTDFLEQTFLDYWGETLLRSGGQEDLLTEMLQQDQTFRHEFEARFYRETLKQLLQHGRRLDEIYEALRLSFTFPELMNMCERQRQRELRRIRGWTVETGAKYIPILYERRVAVEDAFETFLASARSCFALVGEAGIGKTNVLAHLTEKYCQQMPVMFYVTSYLEKGFKEAISEDFAWEFGKKRGASELFRHINLVLGQADKMMLVFLDAINEISDPERRHLLKVQLDTLSEHLIDTRIKLVVSCRDYDWDFFIHDDGRLNNFATNVFTADRRTAEAGTLLDKFNDMELDRCWTRYKQSFVLAGELKGMAREECRHPLMLRFVSEVYVGGAEAIPLDINVKDIFEKYWKTKVSTLGRQKALFDIVEYFYEHKCTDISETRLLTFIDQHIYRALLSEQIVIFKKETPQQILVEFTYEKFLEYSMALYLYDQHGWGRKSDEGIRHDFSRLVIETSQYRTLQGVAYFLILLVENEQLQTALLEDLIARGREWRLFVCNLIPRLKVLDDNKCRLIYRLAGDDDYWVRWAASYALGEILKRGKVELFKIWALDEDWKIREAIALATGESTFLGLEASVKLLEPFFTDIHWRVRRAAGYALNDIYEAKLTECIKYLEDWLSADRWQVRQVVATSFRDVRTPGLVDHVNGFLDRLSRDSSPDVRWEVVRTCEFITGIKGPEAFQTSRTLSILQTLAQDSNVWVRCHVAGVIPRLIGLDDASVVQIFSILARDSDYTVRWAAARALGEKETHDIEKLDALLRDLTEDPDPNVRVAATYSLKGTERLRAARLVETLLEQDDMPPEALMSLREGIARYGTQLLDQPEDLPVFQKWRRDKYQNVLQSVEILLTSNPELAEKLLFWKFLDVLAEDQDEGVRWAVSYCLRLLPQISYPDICDALIEKLAQDTLFWIRREIARTLDYLDYIDSETADRIFQDLSIDPYEEVRWAVTFSVHRCSPAKRVELLARAQQDTSDAVRAAAKMLSSGGT